MARSVPESPAPEGESSEVTEPHASVEPARVAEQEAGHPRPVLPPDWLPVALVLGDAVIAGVSVPVAYWIRYGKADQSLPFGPYLAAIPVGVVAYLVALAVNRQYSSWRGRTLVDQLFSLYSGIGLAAILLLAAIEVGNLGQHYSRLTFIPFVLFTAVLMTA